MTDACSATTEDPLPLGGYPAILAECRAIGVQDSCRRVLNDCLIHLDDQLHGPEGDVDRRGVRLTLRELGDLIGSNRLSLERPEYQVLLARLVAIFATGAAPVSQLALATSAPSYAGVVAALSRACPSCDYEAALGQLLTYMGRLFVERRSGWKSIYRAIASISDRVVAKQRLDEGEFRRIEEWVESGASNLFPIQRDLAKAIAGLEEKAAALAAEMERRTAALGSGGPGARVVSLADRRERIEIAALGRRRDELLAQAEDKRGIRGLIDDDIRELEDALRATRRAYSVRLVWAA
jgi:hypothetical protein